MSVARRSALSPAPARSYSTKTELAWHDLRDRILCLDLPPGSGLAIDEKTPYARDADRRVPALLTTAAGLAAATLEEGRSCARDIAAFVRSPTTFRWLRASGADGFVTGKHGGIYQIHNPGVSAIVFPGYAIDRLLVRGAPGRDDDRRRNRASRGRATAHRHRLADAGQLNSRIRGSCGAIGARS